MDQAKESRRADTGRHFHGQWATSELDPTALPPALLDQQETVQDLQCQGGISSLVQ
jgi:hypothetical protein